MQILTDPCRLFQILEGFSGFFLQILGSTRFSEILIDFLRFSRISKVSSDGPRFFHIPFDFFRSLQILLDSCRISKVLFKSLNFFQILSDSFILLSDSFKFFQTFSKIPSETLKILSNFSVLIRSFQILTVSFRCQQILVYSSRIFHFF